MYIEIFALQKLARAIGATPPPMPKHLVKQFGGRKRKNRCGRCGELGHNRLGCTT